MKLKQSNSIFGLLAMLVVMATLTIMATTARAEWTEAVYDRVRSATVEILIDGQLCGSGCIIDSKGIVLSSGHLFPKPSAKVEILSVAIGRHDAELIAIDCGHDIALIEIDWGKTKRPDNLPVLPLAKKTPSVGSRLFQLGTPIYRRGVLQEGTLSRKTTAFEYLADQNAYVEMVHVGATLQRGTSGGPWVNNYGQLVGIQSGVMSVDNVPVGMAFMIPLEPIKEFLDSRKTTQTPTLGIGVEELWQQTPLFVSRFPQGTQGLVVKLTAPNSTSQNAGLKRQDLIVKVDERPTAEVVDLLRYIRTKKGGQPVTLTVELPGGSGQKQVVVPLSVLEVAWLGTDELNTKTIVGQEIKNEETTLSK
jgi:S1-C subfamily serine protease